jgi:copper resistance protein D
VENILIDPLIVVRDIHFASSVVVAGIVSFDLFIAAPALWADLRLPATATSFGKITQRILWVSLSISFVSALAWLGLLSSRIAGKPFDEVVASGTLWIILSRTQFGMAFTVRIVLAVLLTGFLLQRCNVKPGTAMLRRVLPTLLAGGYLGSLAFSGHGEEGLGLERYVHLASDFLHLIAAGLWLGGLIPLAALLALLSRFREQFWITAVCEAASRFSTLGILAVGMLLTTGVINTSFLVGGIQNLIDTSYGRLLGFKIALFVAMVCLAGINRLHLLPRLCGEAKIDQTVLTVRQLLRGVLAELTLGFGIILIVGMLGIIAPATDMTSHLH